MNEPYRGQSAGTPALQATQKPAYPRVHHHVYSQLTLEFVDALPQLGEVSVKVSYESRDNVPRRVSITTQRGSFANISPDEWELLKATIDRALATYRQHEERYREASLAGTVEST